MIACPHIERASTAETYADRILGVSKTGVAPAYTINAFTGNNIGPKSDQASRSLEARLSTDRPDPENRVFTHEDPIGWTADHRGQILNALYTILLGNPQLQRERRRPAETRFKEWWHLIGSAVEHAAKAYGDVSFKVMFARVEAKDEETSGRAEHIQTLLALQSDEAFLAIKNGSAFTSADLHKYFDACAKAAFNTDEEPGIIELRRFCTFRTAKAPTPQSIGTALKGIVDAPIHVAGDIYELKSADDKHRKTTVFWVAKVTKKTTPA
jgi:hypothetical protein